MANVAVIGAGGMGLTAAYELTKNGHRVTVFEADDRPGGMAAHFDFDGLSLERFYHFVCKADQPTFDLLQELGLENALCWRSTTMAYYYNGQTYSWGTPIALLKFPHLDLLSKLRYGILMFWSTKRSDWRPLDRLRADVWLKAWGGSAVWRILWQKLFDLKFFAYSTELSAAWIWTRIKRIGTSRRSLMQEELGYITGGSQTLVDALVNRIVALGGTLRLSCPVTRLHIENNAVTGVTAGGVFQAFDAVIATVALPYLPALCPDLPADLRARYAAVRNIGVVCVVHKLKRAVTGNFWLNINDPRIDIPGLVEFSSLRDCGDAYIVYVPYYMPTEHPKWTQDDDFFIRESFSYLRLITPQIKDDDRLASHVGRLRFAQPVCGPRFLATLPPIAPGIQGLQIADTSHSYPEDRGLAESIRIAKILAAGVAS